MRIREILNNYRNDMWAMYECEHCGFTMQKLTYANKNYYSKAIPIMKCPMCNKTTINKGGKLNGREA